MDTSDWTVLDAERPVLTRSYFFRPGADARMMVVGIGGGRLAVVSPGAGLPVEALRELERYGKVTALVAPNGYHYLGLPLWQRTFLDARTYAPEQARARIAKKLGIEPPRPLSELQAE